MSKLFHSSMTVSSLPASDATAVSVVSGELMQALAVARQRAEGLATSVALHGAAGGACLSQPAVAVLDDLAFAAPLAYAAGGTLQELVAWADAELCVEQRFDEPNSGARLEGSSAPQVPDVLAADDDNYQQGGVVDRARLLELPPLQSELGQWALWQVQCEENCSKPAACPAPFGIEYEIIEDAVQHGVEARADTFSGGIGGVASGLCGSGGAATTGHEASAHGTLLVPHCPSSKISAGSAVEPLAQVEQVAGHCELCATFQARCDFSE